MVSVYSVISAILFFNIALVLVFILRRNTEFLVRYSVSVLLLLTGLSILRLFAPIDLPDAIVITSEKAIPAVESFLATPLSANLPWLRPSTLLLALWSCGTLAFFIRDVVRLVSAKHQRLHYRPADRPEVQATAEELGTPVPVIATSAVAVPCAGGIIHPVIYFPDIDSSEEDRSFILRHEMQHIRGRDSLIKLFCFLLRDLFWWNPVIHIFLRDLDAMLEMRCDAKVTADMDERSVLRYMRTILTYADRTHISQPDPSPATAAESGFAGESNEVKQRVNILFYLRKRRPGYIRGLIYALLIVAFFASYMVILQPLRMPEDEEMQDLVIYSDEIVQNTYIEKIEGRYYAHLEGFSSACEISEEELHQPPFNEMPIIERNDNP